MKPKQLLTLLTILTTFIGYAQNTITVDNNLGVVEVPNLIYANLQDAIDAAVNGDTLYIQPSATSYGDAILNKQLSFIGRSHSENNKISYVDNIEIYPNASGSIFSGLYFTDKIYFTDENTVNNLIFKNNYINWIDFDFTTGGINNFILTGNVVNILGAPSSITSPIQNGVITNNIFLDDIYIFYPETVTIKNNIFFCYTSQILITNESGNNTELVIENSIILKLNANSGDVSANDNIQFTNCLTYSPNGDIFNVLAGSGNLNNINPQFVNVTDNVFDAYNDDYHLQAGSPAIGTGTDGEDIGLYNSSGYLFNMLGITYGLPSVNITNITQTVQEGEPLQVTIQASSN